MSFGESIKDLRKRKNLSQKTLASDLYVDQTLVSKIETGQRNASDELMRNSASAYSDAQFGFAVAHEIASDYITPLATASVAIEWHRLALEETFKGQAMEAIKKFDEVSLVKNPAFVTDEEKKVIESGIKELLDVQMVMNSFLTILEQEYSICVKRSMRKRIPKWKAMGWIN